MGSIFFIPPYSPCCPYPIPSYTYHYKMMPQSQYRFYTRGTPRGVPHATPTTTTPNARRFGMRLIYVLAASLLARTASAEVSTRRTKAPSVKPDETSAGPEWLCHPSDSYQAGTKVEIHSQSKKNADLNGVVGTVLGKDPVKGESHRYIVENDADEDVLISVKPENLKFLNIPPGLQFADETKNSFVFTGWFQKESGDFHEDTENRKTVKVSPFDKRTFTWNPTTREWHSPKTKPNSTDPKDGDFWMNKEATKFLSINPQNTDLRRSSATKVEANQNSGSAHRSDDVMTYQWQLHVGDSGDASDTDKVWIKLAPAPKRNIPTIKKPVDTKPVIVNPSPGVIPPGLTFLDANKNSFVLTGWLHADGKANYPYKRTLATKESDFDGKTFTWVPSLNEWRDESKKFFMNATATKFLKYETKVFNQETGDRRRVKAATKVSANQDGRKSAYRSKDVNAYQWQLHLGVSNDSKDTDQVWIKHSSNYIKPAARRRLGASPVLCALMDEIASQQ